MRHWYLGVFLALAAREVHAQPADPAPPLPVDPAPAAPVDEPDEIKAADEPAQPAGPVVNPPALLEAPPPEFPANALADRIHGIVVVELTISAEGLVTAAAAGSVTIIPEGDLPRAGDGRYGFGEAAVTAARQMVFSPATYGGQPFEVQINYTYRFALPAKPISAEPKLEETPKGPAQVNFEGALLERGSRSVVPGATITVYRGKGKTAEGFEATSTADGTFQFYDLPAGRWQVKIEREGYIPVETSESFSTTEVVSGKYWVEKGSYSEYDLTIEAERPRKEVNRRSLSVAQISKVPGPVSDDPVLVIENLPGVARSSVASGEIIVRGSGPADTGVFVNGVSVPLIYHFGGLKSILPSKAIGGIDFYPGNYSVQYGRATGGILDLKLKKLEPDIFHGSVDISVLDTSVYLEAPIGDKAAIAIAGRRSYIDFVLANAIPEDAGLSLTSAPRYYDYQILGSYRPKAAHEFRWLGLGSDDALELLFDDPAEVAGPNVATSNDFSARTSFQRLINDYRYTPSEKLSNHARMSFGRNSLNFSALGQFRFELTALTATLRDTFTYKFSDNFTLDTGFDSELNRVDLNIRFPGGGPSQEGENHSDGPGDNAILEQTLEGKFFFDAAPFIEASINIGKLLLVPGLRMDYFGNANAWSVDPRITARYSLPHQVGVKAGAAVVHQSPSFPELDIVFGNPDLELLRAYQYSVGADWNITENIRFDGTLFYKHLDNLVRGTDELVERDGETVAARYDNAGTGRVYGAEVFLEHQFNGKFNGWLSYTLSRAERKDGPGEDYRRFDYDQTHILALVGSYQLGNNWELGARYRYVTGNPSTPVIAAVFNSETDEYSPVFGETNTGRLASFQQFDLRIDKTWIFDTWKFSSYLSLVNATNHRNVESNTYNFDYSEQGSISGLPVLPIFGVKGEW
tara:strand:- start:29364 stop:32117 length:2754 start_codon:yes stop_codon:yes gene_type:complete